MGPAAASPRAAGTAAGDRAAHGGGGLALVVPVLRPGTGLATLAGVLGLLVVVHADEPAAGDALVPLLAVLALLVAAPLRAAALLSGLL